MIKYFCDVCGKELDSMELCRYHQILIKGQGSSNDGVPYMIFNCVCNSCKSKIVSYIKGIMESEGEQS